MEGGGKHPPPPQCYNETKKPSAYRVKLPVTSAVKVLFQFHIILFEIDK